MRTFNVLLSLFARLFLILNRRRGVAEAILVVAWSPWNAQADFHVLLRTTLLDGAAADEVVSWKDVTAFVGGASHRIDTASGWVRQRRIFDV
jgi:hypothetical protein